MGLEVIGYRLHPETISPLFSDLLSTTILFRDSQLHPKQLSLFCLLWLSSAIAGRIGCITSFCSMIIVLYELKNSSSAV